MHVLNAHALTAPPAARWAGRGSASDLLPHVQVRGKGTQVQEPGWPEGPGHSSWSGSPAKRAVTLGHPRVSQRWSFLVYAGRALSPPAHPSRQPARLPAATGPRSPRPWAAAPWPRRAPGVGAGPPAPPAPPAPAAGFWGGGGRGAVPGRCAR